MNKISSIKSPSRIELFRREHRLRQADLARSVGVSRSYVALVESGWVPPPRRQAAFAEALKVEVADLWLGGRAR